VRATPDNLQLAGAAQRRVRVAVIDSAEIDAKSAELGVHVAHVQRDYVFGWVLAGLFQTSNSLSERLALKGGNAFRKAYFEHARYSNDLDFSTETELGEEELRSAVAEACAFAGEQSGVDFEIADTRVQSRQTADQEGRLYEARVYFRSFYGEEDVIIRIDLDVKEFDRIILAVQTRQIIHSYSDADACAAAIRCHKLEELLASKLVALLHRNHSPDLYDFVHSIFFQKALDVNRRQIITTFLKKSIYEPTPLIARGLLLDLPFAVLRSLWNTYLVCPRNAAIEFDEAERGFRSVIAELFGLLAPQPAFAGRPPTMPAQTYFVGDIRGAILEAGRLQRILRLRYDGYERRVEPYALVFKRRKDGVGHEYFYGWDLTGGKSGTIGIKSFFANKITGAEATEETFDPKFPIELTKGATGYFTRSTFAATRSHSVRRRARSHGRTYTIQCPYCGKRFRRSRLDRKLNEHKDKYGNRCFARVGFVVSTG
jgi:predicted nucleotidyltransferase component of viral defense system